MVDMQHEAPGWFTASSVSVEKYFACTSLSLILIFAWMEPAAAPGIGFGKGLIFWAVQIAILMPLLISTQHFMSHYLYLKHPSSPWLQTAFSGVLGALLFVPIAYLLDTLFGIPDDASSMGIIEGLLDEASGVLVPVTITWLALNAPWILQLDFSKRESELGIDRGEGASPVDTVKETAGFLQELKSRASGELISISSELHYLRVTTTDAEVMFLYNLKDAIKELPADAGLQIHRSHWVSKEHVKELSKKDGNAECLLSNGKSLPVSRRKYLEVKDALADSGS